MSIINQIDSQSIVISIEFYEEQPKLINLQYTNDIKII